MKKTITAQVLADILTARNAEVSSKDTELAISNLLRNAKAVDIALSLDGFKETAKALARDFAIADKKQNRDAFIAVKVGVKVVAGLCAIGKSMKAELDPYSRTIIENLVKLNGISNKDALVSLSRSVEYDETEQVAHLVARYNCSVTTAGTQASSTRMMLRALDICEVNKGKRGDIITLKDNDRARAMVALFQTA